MTVSNSFVLPASTIAKEALAILQNNLVIGNLAYRGYESEFLGAKKGDTITIRKPASFRVDQFTSTIDPQSIQENSTTLTLDTHFDMSFELSTKQLTLELNDFSTQVVQPAMVNFAENLDAYLYSKYFQVNEIEGDGTANALSDVIGLDRKQMEQKIPMAGRVAVVGPATKANLLGLEAFYRADIRGANAIPALTDASMGRVMGYDWYSAQAVKYHTAGVPGGTPVGTGTTGSAALVVASGGNAGTFKQGDIITIAGGTETYAVQADVTLNSSGAGTLTLSPVLTRDVSGAAITLKSSHYANLAGNFRGLSLVSVPLEMPMQAMGAAQVNWNGLNLRVVYDYDVNTKKNVISFDCLVGAKVTDPRLLTRFAG